MEMYSAEIVYLLQQAAILTNLTLVVADPALDASPLPPSWSEIFQTLGTAAKVLRLLEGAIDSDLLPDTMSMSLLVNRSQSEYCKSSVTLWPYKLQLSDDVCGVLQMSCADLCKTETFKKP